MSDLPIPINQLTANRAAYQESLIKGQTSKLDTLTDKVKDLVLVVTRQQMDIAGLRAEVTSLKDLLLELRK